MKPLVLGASPNSGSPATPTGAGTASSPPSASEGTQRRDSFSTNSDSHDPDEEFAESDDEFATISSSRYGHGTFIYYGTSHILHYLLPLGVLFFSFFLPFFSTSFFFFLLLPFPPPFVCYSVVSFFVPFFFCLLCPWRSPLLWDHSSHSPTHTHSLSFPTCLLLWLLLPLALTHTLSLSSSTRSPLWLLLPPLLENVRSHSCSRSGPGRAGTAPDSPSLLRHSSKQHYQTGTLQLGEMLLVFSFPFVSLISP